MNRSVDIQPSRFHFSDLVAEAVAGMLQRPGRSVLTMVGTILGIGSLVAILGLTDTAQGQVDRQFSVLQATQIVVSDAAMRNGETTTTSFPDDADRRAAGVLGVEAAGRFWRLDPDATRVSSSLAVEPLTGIDVFAASPGLLEAVDLKVVEGRLYSEFEQSRSEPVVVLSRVAARRLAVNRLEDAPAVFIDDKPFLVVAIVEGTDRLPALGLGALIPTTTAERNFEPTGQEGPQMLVRTRLGAAGTVARQLPVAIRPDGPQLLSVVPPPRVQALERNVTRTVNGLFVLLASVSVIVGGIGIATTTLVATMERRGEIALRRALGARPKHIAVQFMAESATIGLVGGLIGTSLGVLTVVTTAMLRNWTALLNPLFVLPMPVAGALIGLLAGLYPAVRASRIEPAVALRP